MKKTVSSIVIIALALLTGCASTESMVQSSRATKRTIEEGVVYSLPKQLVKVVYNRTVIDLKKAKKNVKDAKANVDATTLEIGNQKKAQKEKEQLIKDIDKKSPGGTALEAKTNQELAKIKAEMLRLSRALARKKEALVNAANNYAQALEGGKAFDEKLSIDTESPIPDTSNTFYAKVLHRGAYSDSLELKTKNGLLDGAIGYNEDQSGEIIVSLVSSLSGLISFPVGVPFGPKTLTIPSVPLVSGGCQKKPVISVKQVIDPSNQNDLGVLNKKLRDGCISLEIDIPETAQESALTVLTNANGLVYRQPGDFTFKVKNVDDDSEIESIRLTLAQGGQVGIISMPKGRFSKNEYDVSFSNGMLSKSKLIQPSEVLGAVKIIPNAIKGIFALPTELIQLKVDYSSSENALAELKKTMLETQIEIDKKQKELEGLATAETTN